MTQSASQLFRRAKLDAGFAEESIDNMWMIVGILKNFYRDDYRLSLFNPAIGYDDLFQELLVELVVEVPRKFNPDKGVPYSAFVHMLLINKLRDLLRTEGKYFRCSPLELMVESEAEPVVMAVGELESTLMVYEFAQALSPLQRSIFLLRYADASITFRDMEPVLGVGRSTISRELKNIQQVYLAYQMDEHLPVPEEVLYD